MRAYREFNLKSSTRETITRENRSPFEYTFISICVYMKTRTTYDLRQAWKKARAKPYSASTQVVLMVQQKSVATSSAVTTATGLQVGVTGGQHQRPVSLSAGTTMVSPSQPATSLHRASTAPAAGAQCNARITGPQPVDFEKKRQLETQRVHTFQLMLEKEQSYVDKLRSDLAKASTSSGNVNIVALQAELAGAERRVRTLQEQLAAITTNEQLCSLVTNTSCSPGYYSPLSGSSGDVPPPLPSRKSLSMQSLSPPPLPPRPPPTTNTHNVAQLELERHLLTHVMPSTTSHGIPNSLSQGANLGSSNSLNKHQRTKSSPEQLGTTTISPSEASRRLIASESMNDLSPPRHVRHSDIDIDELPHITPPGTPPPPYPVASPGNDTSNSTINDTMLNESIPGLPTLQRPIMSMEDDDMSDQEVGQLEDHGPFKSLSRLWEHHAHLAVFINYVLSNSDPSSLLFYLVTDLYKEGNTKEMRKWAYEIHSSFLVPGAPLRLHNVEENVAHEIDDVLLKESDKEEILRKIFWKARIRAKEELNAQLTDFQQKRTAGLGTLFGPSDAQLDESASDRARETKIIETYLLPKMDPYLEDIEKENVDLRQFTTAAGLATILTKIFQVRPVSLERVPTFVAKDKTNIKVRLLTGKSRKMTIRGHHFVAHQYFTITYCNHCQHIIGGIGPQGYLCSDCSLSVHRQCVRVVEESCPGPLVRKERDRISKLMERIRPERKPPSSHHHHHSQNHMLHIDKIKKSEEDTGALTDGENVLEPRGVHMVELQQLRDPLEGEPDHNPYSTTNNPSPLIASFASFRLSSERCRNRLNRKLKGDGTTVVLEKVSKDKVAKKTKLKTIKQRSAVPHMCKGSLAGKVWETFAAVRRTREPNEIIETALIVGLDRLNVSTCCETLNDSAFCDETDSSSKLDSSVTKEISGAEKRTGEHRGGGVAGNARSSSERGRISAYSGVSDHADNMDNPSSREDISEMVQQNISSKPKTSNINRSESYKERIHHKRQLREKRKTSDPNLSKTKAGFSDCEPAGTFPGNSAGSSSNSSLSTRSLDSPSTSLEQVHPATSAANTSTSWDSDVDVEPDPPDWSQGVAEDVLSRLSNAEKKRQEVINELFHTERSHVRALRVLSQVFHKPLLESQVLPLDQIQLLFSNLDEMVTIHSRFNQAMKRKKKENPCVGDVGELLLEMFDGENGESFERAASTYCAKQQVALDALRDRRRKDPKLNSFLNEIEANPLCRRLQLKDHILTGMLRLTKYPLLFENLAKYTPESNDKERTAVLRSLERSKEILSRVNQAVREAEDYHRLAEIQRTIDRTAFDKFDHPTVQEFKNLDITKRKLIYEGPLQWRRTEQNRAKPVDLHVVLLDDTIFLLHRQDEKYLLKFINTNQANSVLSPIVKVSTVLVRHNAVDKNSLYLVNTSQNGAQIYDLVAASPAERKLWCKHISEAAEAYKARDKQGRRPTPPTTLPEEPGPMTEDISSTEHDNILDKTDQQPEQEVETKDSTSNTSVEQETEAPNTPGPEPSTSEQTKQQQQPPPSTEPSATGIGEPLRMVTCTQVSLIDPLEVHVEVPPVHVAEPVFTPIECLRRKDEIIKQALIEKQLLVADILNIPKEDYEHVADMASEPSSMEKEPAELILAAISQANQLVGMLNSALNVSETETVLASRGTSSLTASPSCEATGCPSPRLHFHSQQPAIPIASLQPVCHSLTSQLSQLLEIVKEREEERETLRKELRRSRERLHALDADIKRRDFSETCSTSCQTQTESGEILNKESSIDDTTRDEFADARGESETNEESEHTEHEIETEVMGDSVG
ncbi:rho guanine nucleotide exchange factor 2 isoform X3 [Megachile rotundata]|uniref:rho guanine nucleotide exchange factor 2 isoform X3 n=1 Tax=Megachile rotundata TaxID=143995 RepID=UPI003FD52E76